MDQRGETKLAFVESKIPAVTLIFWLAFVLTRPFGATMGDVLTKPTEKGGLNLGTVGPPTGASGARRRR